MAVFTQKQTQLLSQLFDDVAIKQQAQRQADEIYNPKIAALKRRLDDGIDNLSEQSIKEIQDQNQKQAEVSSAYAEEAQSIQDQILRRGMARSSVALNMIQENQIQKQQALMVLAKQSQDRLMNIKHQIEELKRDMSSAIDEANVQKATDAASRLDTLRRQGAQQLLTQNALQEKLDLERQKLAKASALQQQKLAQDKALAQQKLAQEKAFALQKQAQQQKEKDDKQAQKKLAPVSKTASSALASAISSAGKAILQQIDRDNAFEALRKSYLSQADVDAAIASLKANSKLIGTVGEKHYNSLLAELLQKKKGRTAASTAP